MTRPPSPRHRLPEAETTRRMMDAAVARVLRDGLSVGVDQLSMEEVIVEAGVARSAVYRRWPSREAFYARVLVELLRRDDTSIHYYSAATLTEVEGFLAGLGPIPREREPRRRLLVELCRLAATHNFEQVRNSPAQRTHQALTALIQSGGPEFRAEGLALLRESERRFTARMVPLYRQFFDRFGLRLAEGLDWPHFVALAAASVQGAAVQADAIDDSAAAPLSADPFGTGREAPWCLAAIGFTALVLSVAEFT